MALAVDNRKTFCRFVAKDVYFFNNVNNMMNMSHYIILWRKTMNYVNKLSVALLVLCAAPVLASAPPTDTNGFNSAGGTNVLNDWNATAKAWAFSTDANAKYKAADFDVDVSDINNPVLTANKDIDANGLKLSKDAVLVLTKIVPAPQPTGATGYTSAGGTTVTEWDTTANAWDFPKDAAAKYNATNFEIDASDINKPVVKVKADVTIGGVDFKKGVVVALTAIVKGPQGASLAWDQEAYRTVRDAAGWKKGLAVATPVALLLVAYNLSPAAQEKMDNGIEGLKGFFNDVKEGNGNARVIAGGVTVGVVGLGVLAYVKRARYQGIATA